MAAFWRRLLGHVAFVAEQEPALIQAVWKAIVGIVVATGATVPGWLEPRVAGVIAGVYTLLALWQGEATRARVVPAVWVPDQYHAEHRKRQP